MRDNVPDIAVKADLKPVFKILNEIAGEAVDVIHREHGQRHVVLTENIFAEKLSRKHTSLPLRMRMRRRC